MNYWIMPDIAKKPTIEELLNDICLDLEIDLIKLKSKSRLMEIADKRHIAMFILHRWVGLTTEKTGKIFNRDHATVLHACSKVENLQLINEELIKYKYIKLKK